MRKARYLCKKYARDEITARAFLAGHGATFLERGTIQHHNKQRAMVYGFSLLHNCVVYCIIADNGVNNLHSIRAYIGSIPCREPKTKKI